VTARVGVTASNTTVTELEDTVRAGDPVSAGAPAATVIVCDGGELGSTEFPLGSTSEFMVTVIVPATVPWLNCELLPDQTAAVLPAGTVNARVVLSVELHAGLVVPLANTTS